MKKVKYNIGDTDNKFFNIRVGLTDGKVYDVVQYIKGKYGVFWDRVIIINDFNEEYIYDVCDQSNNTILFTEAITEYRNSVIDEILL